MAQSSSARSKGAQAGGRGPATVHLVLPAATAKDLLNALTQALGPGGRTKVAAKAGAKAKASPKAASRAASKAAPKAGAKAGSRAAKKG